MSRSDRFFESIKNTARSGSPARPRLFGLLNPTPDSFSDGGAHTASPEVSLQFAAQLVAAGADALDLGAESTRPGSGAVPADENEHGAGQEQHARKYGGNHGKKQQK